MAHLPPPGLLEALRRRFSPLRARYVASVLTPGEFSVIADPGDALIIARIKRMSRHRLERFDNLVPMRSECRHYQMLQSQWLRDEEYLLQTRLGRRPTHKELFIDFMNNSNGLRFRAYFAMKFPGRMVPAGPAAC